MVYYCYTHINWFSHLFLMVSLGKNMVFWTLGEYTSTLPKLGQAGFEVGTWGEVNTIRSTSNPFWWNIHLPSVLVRRYYFSIYGLSVNPYYYQCECSHPPIYHPSYFDVNYRATFGFDPVRHMV